MARRYARRRFDHTRNRAKIKTNKKTPIKLTGENTFKKPEKPHCSAVKRIGDGRRKRRGPLPPVGRDRFAGFKTF